MLPAGNGIKFTKKGEVVVYVSVKSRTSDTVELLFAVKDTGADIVPCFEVYGCVYFT